MNDRDVEQRIREHAYQIWVSEGRPEGRARAHWEMARELVAIEDNQRDATKPNPATADLERDVAGAEPIEAVENRGEFPTLTDQGEEQANPTRRRRRRTR